MWFWHMCSLQQHSKYISHDREEWLLIVDELQLLFFLYNVIGSQKRTENISGVFTHSIGPEPKRGSSVFWSNSTDNRSSKLFNWLLVFEQLGQFFA